MNRNLASLTQMVQPDAKAQTELKLIPLDALKPFQDQDRERIDQKKLDPLKASFARRIEGGEVPNIEPIHVEPGPDGEYIIHSGHRRHLAALAIGHAGNMLCAIHHLDRNAMSEIMALCNLEREPLCTADLALAVARRVEAAIWNRETAMALLNTSHTNYAALMATAGAPEQVLELSRTDKVQSPRILARIAALPEPEQTQFCQIVMEKGFNESLLVGLEMKTNPQGEDQPQRAARRPKAAKIHATSLRMICDHSPELRKRMKAAARETHSTSRLLNIDDADFTALFCAMLEQMILEASEGQQESNHEDTED